MRTKPSLGVGVASVNPWNVVGSTLISDHIG